jgi:hypothetical protein
VREGPCRWAAPEQCDFHPTPTPRIQNHFGGVASARPLQRAEPYGRDGPTSRLCATGRPLWPVQRISAMAVLTAVGWPVCYNGFNESECAVAGYKVLIDDNFHFMDEDERIQHGVFATADEAIAACKLIVDECLKPMLQPGMAATALYEQYKGFGDDPFIMPVDPNDAPLTFSAWAYAEKRCEVLASPK